MLEHRKSASVHVYTVCISFAGDRRIRVHTLLLPVSDRPEDILAAADQQAIVSLLAKMAAEKIVMVRNCFELKPRKYNTCSVIVKLYVSEQLEVASLVIQFHFEKPMPIFVIVLHHVYSLVHHRVR